MDDWRRVDPDFLSNEDAGRWDDSWDDDDEEYGDSESHRDVSAPLRSEPATLPEWIESELATLDLMWKPDIQSVQPERQMLFHYTTADGVLGILTSQRLYATGASYMNDASEWNYAQNVVSQVLDDKIDYATPELERTFLERCSREWWNPITSLYVVSFCEEGDLLSQWRAYGGATGYSLGIRTGDWGFVEQSLAMHGSGVSLVEVLYEPEQQRSVAQDILEQAITSLHDSRERWQEVWSEEVAVAALAQRAAAALFRFALRLKHPAFREEREWRIIYVRRYSWKDRQQPRLEIKHRSSRFGIVPYVELDLTIKTDDFDDVIPVIEAYHAPSERPQLARGGLRSLLDTLGYEGTTIRGAKAPIRL